MESVSVAQSDQEILLQKVCRRNSAATLSSCNTLTPAPVSSSVLRSCSIVQAVGPLVAATRASQLRAMSAGKAVSLDHSVSHSDSTEFDMPFGIDDDDLVNYQPPVLVASRTSSAKYCSNRSSSKSFDLETFEEEPLELSHDSTDQTLCTTTRSAS